MAASNDTIRISPFRKALHFVADNLEETEVRRIKFLCKEHILSKRVRETANVWDVFDAMESKEIISPRKYTFLLNLLTEIKREDLRSKFLQKMNPVVGPSAKVPVSNPPWNSKHSSPPGHLMPPSHYTSTSQRGNFEGPNTRRRSEQSFAGQSNTRRRVRRVDESPISTWQSSSKAAYPKVRASPYGVGEDNSTGCSEWQPDASSKPDSVMSAKEQDPGNLVQGSNVDGIMPSQSQSGTEQGTDPASPSRVTSERDAPWMSSSRQGGGATTWPRTHRSQNCTNCSRVKKMEAIEQLEAVNEDQRLDKVHEGQNERMEEVPQEEDAELHQSMTDLDKINICCKKCSSLLCKASELRLERETDRVICTSQEFKTWVKEVRLDRGRLIKDDETLGIECGTFHCDNRLGTMQKPDEYDLHIQSLMIKNDMGDFTSPETWKEAGFNIMRG